MDDRFKYLGIVSGITGWLVILIAIQLNPWFVFTEYAFSDLGGRLASKPWVFNYGMMFTGLLIISYGYYLSIVSSNRVMTLGSVFTVLTGVALFLVGRYPTGMAPHFMVSIWFFTQGDLSIGAWGLGLLRGENKTVAWIFVALSVIGPIGAVLVNWPSTAVLEAYGIVLMNIWVTLMTRL
jgi:hypothetical membrane protein